MSGAGTQLLQRRKENGWSVEEDRRDRSEAAAGITNGAVVLVSGVLCDLCRFLRRMMPMVSMLCGMLSDRLMNGLRRLFLGKGHHRAMCKAHEAEQHGQNDPKAWAESPERSHSFHVKLSPARGQLTFGNPAGHIDPAPGEA